MSIEDRLKEINVTLPDVPAPGGNYVHAVRTGNLLFLPGKGPGRAGGKVGADVDVGFAYEDARTVGLILIAVMKQELGSLDRVNRIVKVLAWSTPPPTSRSSLPS